MVTYQCLFHIGLMVETEVVFIKPFCYLDEREAE